MPRPTKCRRVCQYPQTLEFRPVQDEAPAETVVLTVDEYEAIRLIDHQGLSQAQCSQRMQIARATVQKIYDSARCKLAQVLVQGAALRIQGGEYRLCDGGNEGCGEFGCLRPALYQTYQTTKGEDTMRLAVTYENGQVFQHFGHTEAFKIYDIREGQILSSQVVPTQGSGHGALAGFLSALQVDALICGGIGGGAQMALAEARIRLFGGVQGDADAAVAAFLAGQLSYDPNARCDHHDHGHGEGHTCGSHGCGHGSCGHH